MRFKATVAAAGVAALMIAGIGFAQAPGGSQPPPGRQAPGMGMGMRGPGGGLQRLNLTKEQQQQVQELMATEREAMRDTAGKMPELQRQLHEAIFLGKGDVSAIAQQINDLQAQLLQARIAHQQKLAAILTPEQREQMAKMRPMDGPPMGRMGRGRGSR